MRNLTPEIIASVTGGQLVGSDDAKTREISFITTDSRKTGEGCLFAAIPGERVDGHSFIGSAAEKGAACILCERGHDVPGVCSVIVGSTLTALRDIAEYYRTQFDIPVVGIVGSVGKTTAKEMTAAILSQRFNTLKTEGNFNNELGVPLTLFRLRPEHEAAVLELGISDFGEMTRLSKMARPDICLMTTIGYCHLEKLRDLNGVLRAKSEVFTNMKPDSVAVLNGDDAMLRDFDPGIRKITFGFGEHCDVRAEKVENQGFNGTSFDIVTPGARFHAFVPAFGSHVVISALSAAAVGLAAGLSPSEIVRGLESYETIDGRANVIDTGYIKIIDDCYNANPNSVTSALLSLSSLPGRRVAILGDMLELGPGEKELHREVGTFAGKCGIDSLICCGRLAEFIYKGLISSGASVESWQFPMKDAFFSVLPSLIRGGDTVLVKASHSMKFEEIVEELKKLR